jgi:hypothetical protein
MTPRHAILTALVGLAFAPALSSPGLAAESALTPEQTQLLKETRDGGSAWDKIAAGKDAAGRLALLKAIEAGGVRPGGLLEHVYETDPDAQVWTHALDRWIETKSWRLKVGNTLSRQMWVAKVRDDYDRCDAGLEKLYAAKKGDPDFKSPLAELLYDVLGELVYPAAVPAGGKLKVTLPRLRGRERQLELAEADAARMRAHYARVLQVFNQLVDAGIKPSPEAPQKVADWWKEHGGKRIWAERRREQYKAAGDKAFRKADDPANVIVASCIGTGGTEWLAGGGVGPDGMLSAVGNSLGPKLDFPGVKARLLGDDRVAPQEPQACTGDSRGKPWRWSNAAATPFVLRLDADLKGIVSVTRLPWAAGGVTGVALDAEGNLYLAGARRAGFAGLPVKSEPLAAARVQPPAATPAKTFPPPDHPDLYDVSFLLKLSPDAGRVLWARTVEGKGIRPPEVRIRKDGRIAWTAFDQRILDADGKQIGAMEAMGRLDGRSALDPTTGCLWRTGEHQWGTGHEPYRCPYVTAARPDGWKLTLWHFDGPYVGGATGNVADSGFNRVRIDENGDLLLCGWAHGGNTVLGGQPLDILKPIPCKGFGNAGSSGAQGVGYAFRVSAKTWTVTGKTGQTGAKFEDLAVARDGSLQIIAGASWGIVQTDNNISTGDPAGQYVMISNGDLSQLRFSSAMNPAGMDVQVGDAENNMGWGMASGLLKGRPVALFFSGTAEKGEVYGSIATPPQLNPIQKGFAGGKLDGYLLVLDLSSKR